MEARSNSSLMEEMHVLNAQIKLAIERYNEGKPATEDKLLFDRLFDLLNSITSEQAEELDGPNYYQLGKANYHAGWYHTLQKNCELAIGHLTFAEKILIGEGLFQSYYYHTVNLLHDYSASKNQEIKKYLDCLRNLVDEGLNSGQYSKGCHLMADYYALCGAYFEKCADLRNAIFSCEIAVNFYEQAENKRISYELALFRLIKLYQQFDGSKMQAPNVTLDLLHQLDQHYQHKKNIFYSLVGDFYSFFGEYLKPKDPAQALQHFKKSYDIYNQLGLKTTARDVYNVMIRLQDSLSRRNNNSTLFGSENNKEETDNNQRPETRRHCI